MAEIDVRKLAEQLDTAQAILDEIRVTSGCATFGPARELASKRVETALKTAQRAFDERKTRTDFVGSSEMFGEPAWDMLLDLFIRQTKDEQISGQSVFINAEAPTATAKRWLKVLEQNGLISAHPDPAGSEVGRVHLTPTGYEGMLRYLETIAR